jgi:hypothetical protein
MTFLPTGAAFKSTARSRATSARLPSPNDVTTTPLVAARRAQVRHEHFAPKSEGQGMPGASSAVGPKRHSWTGRLFFKGGTGYGRKLTTVSAFSGRMN